MLTCSIATSKGKKKNTFICVFVLLSYFHRTVENNQIKKSFSTHKESKILKLKEIDYTS